MIELKDINKTYVEHGIETVALSDVNLSIGRGEFISIVGTSGSGKSTLLNILGAMDRPTSGTYCYEDIRVSELKKNAFDKFRKEHISFVFQYFELMEHYTVYENIEMPLLARNMRNRKDKVMECVAALHIEDLVRKKVNHLSGGQKQRVAIARALVTGANLILADEPTGALDKANSQALMDIFGKLHEKGRTIILITHDEEIADRCDRKIRIEDGRLYA